VCGSGAEDGKEGSTPFDWAGALQNLRGEGVALEASRSASLVSGLFLLFTRTFSGIWDTSRMKPFHCAIPHYQSHTSAPTDKGVSCFVRGPRRTSPQPSKPSSPPPLPLLDGSCFWHYGGRLEDGQGRLQHPHEPSSNESIPPSLPPLLFSPSLPSNQEPPRRRTASNR
jgi:hypothetical protein